MRQRLRLGNKVSKFSLAVFAALFATVAMADISIQNVCSGMKFERPKDKSGKPSPDLYVRCPNGKSLRIVGYCKGGVVRVYWGSRGVNYLTCNSVVNPLVLPQPKPTTVIVLP